MLKRLLETFARHATPAKPPRPQFFVHRRALIRAPGLYAYHVSDQRPRIGWTIIAASSTIRGALAQRDALDQLQQTPERTNLSDEDNDNVLIFARRQAD